MKKRINLFKKEDVFAKLDVQLRKVNLYAIVVATFLLAGFLALFGYNLYLASQVTDLNIKEQQLTHQLDQSNVQFRLNYISSKTDTLKSFMKNDAHFMTYYSLIKNLIDSYETTLPPLETFKINNSQQVTFSFSVKNYADLQQVMQFIETKEFTSLFKTLKVNSATYDAIANDTLVTLEFSGEMNYVPPTT